MEQMISTRLNTLTARRMLSEIDSEKKLKGLICRLHDSKDNWKEYIIPLVAERDVSISSIAEKTKISRPTVTHWISDGMVPAKRSQAIALGMALNLNQEGIDRLLSKAGYQQLYPRSLYDIPYIHLIRQQQESGECLYLKYDDVLRRLEVEAKDENHGMVEGTRFMQQRIAGVKGMDGLCDELRGYCASFRQAGDKMLGIIDDWLSPDPDEININGKNDESVSRHSILKDDPLHNKLEQHISHISQDGLPPKRDFLIAICIALRMPLEIINDTMAQSGFQDGLSPLNPWEATLTYCLDELFLKIPSTFGFVHTMSYKRISEFIPSFRELWVEEDTSHDKEIDEQQCFREQISKKVLEIMQDNYMGTETIPTWLDVSQEDVV